jgi:hypothetical protein
VAFGTLLNAPVDTASGRVEAMVRISSDARQSRPKTGRSRPSIREVVVLAAEALGDPPSAGDPIAWAGRSYRVLAVDSGDYLHVGSDGHPSRCSS